MIELFFSSLAPPFKSLRLKALLVMVVILGLVVVVCFFPPQSYSSETGPVVFSDDFSDGLAKWQPTRDDGQHWKVVDGQAEALVPTGSTITELVPRDEFWDENWQAVEFSYQLTPLEGVDRNTSFGYQDLLNWYELHFVPNTLNLVHLVDGRARLNIFEPFHMVNGQSYQIKIQHRTDNVKVFIDNELVLDQDDWTFDNSFGKVGLKAGTGSVFPTKVLYDNVEVRLIDDSQGQKLAVPLFKQTDPSWADDEYDSAQTWVENSATTTMASWGCLTTSAAMVLNFHGLTTLPDGQTLSPGSLNSWLKTQVDGYIGAGLMNWLALSRLSRQLSELNGTPKLEYQLFSSDLLQTATAEVEAKRPPILEAVGHFFVGSGVASDKQDLYIHDPAFDYQLLSQHHTDLISVRQLKPSQTDLSYIVIVHSPQLTLKLLDLSGQELDQTQTVVEAISAPGTNSQTPSQVVTQIAKPATGTYTISVSRAEFGEFELEVYAYDVDANPSFLKQTGFVGKDPITIELNYNRDGSSQFQLSSSWETFDSLLSDLLTTRLISKHFLAFRMMAEVKKAQQGFQPASTSLEKLNQYLIAYSSYFESGADDYLLKHLNSLKAGQ